MADLVVSDLEGMVSDLTELIDQFEGALDFQNDDKGLWGQHNANLAMGDFAANWTINRDEMVKDMRGLRDKITQVNEAWEQEDQHLAQSLSDT